LKRSEGAFDFLHQTTNPPTSPFIEKGGEIQRLIPDGKNFKFMLMDLGRRRPGWLMPPDGMDIWVEIIER
jgi:hypothetical protein